MRIFDFFKRRELPERRDFRLGFVNAVDGAAIQPEDVQAVIGAGLNLTHSLFISKYESNQLFRARSGEDRLEAVRAFNSFSVGLQSKDPYLAAGAALFSKWLTAVAAEDEQLAREFASRLAPLSRKGELAGRILAESMLQGERPTDAPGQQAHLFTRQITEEEEREALALLARLPK